VRLVVEVDGAQHRGRRTADARRDRELRRLGCVVLRIDAEVVMRELPRAVAIVRAVLASLRP
jgi:very-short-patch-repair endonuclease